MDTDQIKSLLENALELEEVMVKSDGSHYQLIVVGACFDGLSRVKQQQMVLAPLMEHITNGSMHAVTVKAYTPQAWARDKKLLQLP